MTTPLLEHRRPAATSALVNGSPELPRPAHWSNRWRGMFHQRLGQTEGQQTQPALWSMLEGARRHQRSGGKVGGERAGPARSSNRGERHRDQRLGAKPPSDVTFHQRAGEVALPAA